MWKDRSHSEEMSHKGVCTPSYLSRQNQKNQVTDLDAGIVAAKHAKAGYLVSGPCSLTMVLLCPLFPSQLTKPIS